MTTSFRKGKCGIWFWFLAVARLWLRHRWDYFLAFPESPEPRVRLCGFETHLHFRRKETVLTSPTLSIFHLRLPRPIFASNAKRCLFTSVQIVGLARPISEQLTKLFLASSVSLSHTRHWYSLSCQLRGGGRGSLEGEGGEGFQPQLPGPVDQRVLQYTAYYLVGLVQTFLCSGRPLLVCTSTERPFGMPILFVFLSFDSYPFLRGVFSPSNSAEVPGGIIIFLPSQWQLYRALDLFSSSRLIIEALIRNRCGARHSRSAALGACLSGRHARSH